jgi:hypothetical protein
MLQAAWLTEAVSHWLVDSVLPHQPYKILAMGFKYPRHGLTEAAVMWISGLVEADNLDPVKRMVALVPDNLFAEQTCILTAMTQLLTLRQASLLFTLSMFTIFIFHPTEHSPRCWNETTEEIIWYHSFQ